LREDVENDVQLAGTPIRSHGFERPFHPSQVVSWVEFAVSQVFINTGLLLLFFPVGTVPITQAFFLNLMLSVLIVLIAIKVTHSNPGMLTDQEKEHLDTLKVTTLS